MEGEAKKTDARRILFVFSLLLFAAALLLCTRIRFSDGDDAFFLEHTASRSLAEFVSWRYQTWSGRIFAESAIWISFRAGIVFWRLVNALMLTALPLLLLRLAEGPFPRLSRKDGKSVLLFLLTTGGAYRLLSLRVAGYACLWITGSLNYLHGAVFATAALIPLRDALDGETRTAASAHAHESQTAGRMLPKYAAGILCAALGAGFAEQIAAILFVLTAIGCVQCFRLHHEFRFAATAMTLCAFAVLLVSLLAPGNALRNTTSEEWYFPGFSSLPLSARLFVTAQYVLSSFSHENSLLFALLSFAVFLCLAARKELPLRIRGTAGVITVFSALASMGVKYCSDMGLRMEALEQAKAAASSWGILLPEQRFTMLLWGMLLIAFGVCLWYAFEKAPLPLLLLPASVASAAVMGFSPTVYASGARALFPSAWMLWLVLVMTYRRLPEGRIRMVYTGVLYAAGVAHAALLLGQVARMLQAA